MSNKDTKTAERLKAMAEPTRLKILKMLSQEEMCVCEIIEGLHLSQPAVSHHLKILRQAELISDRKEGKWIFYSLNREECHNLLEDLRHDYLRDNPAKEKHAPSICCNIDTSTLEEL